MYVMNGLGKKGGGGGSKTILIFATARAKVLALTVAETDIRSEINMSAN